MQVTENSFRMLEGPIRQHDHMLPVKMKGFAVFWIYDQRTIGAGLFLKSGMAVIPVGACLLHRVMIFVSFTGLDAVEIHAWYSIHAKWHQNTVPVDGSVLGVHKPVGDI